MHGMNGHSNLALMVVKSSPVRRRGATLNVIPSISPTPNSEELTLFGSPGCVPPVIFSVFSGIRSLGTYFESTELIKSGGGLSAPTEGISLSMVELVFVM